jgi:hypothetical protein
MFYATFLCVVAFRLADTGVNRRAFSALSIGFLILAAGEIEINSHSIYIDRFVSLIGTGSPTAIILPLFVVPIGAALYLRRFLMQLPPRHAVLFVAFGAIYVSGVLGAEMVSQSLALSHGYSSSAYTLAAGVEETLETIGIFGFCVAMSRYIQELCAKVFVTPPA